MENYRTAEEIAVEWNVTPHHVQHLCRNNRIDGAVKRAGVWFIPADAVVPVKNTKSGIRDFRFVGTKNKIFDSAICLFMTKGYNDVSLKDIAADVGIRQSTIYNHFKSKQEILDTIYQYYSFYYRKNRPSLQDMETVLRTQGPSGLINGIRYEFEEEFRQRMSDITIIVFQRLAIDEQAREIGKSLMLNEGIEYVTSIFNRGIEAGLLLPFDTRSMAVLINSIRIFTLCRWITDPSPEGVQQLVEDERLLCDYAGRHLSTLMTSSSNR